MQSSVRPQLLSLIDCVHSTETKSQFARDDPAFLVLLILCIFGESNHRCHHLFIILSVYCLLNWSVNSISEFSVTSIGFTWTLNLTFGQTFYCILYIVVVDFILAGLIVSTLTWLFTNRYLRERVTDADIEWGYCFDVHLNAFFPPLVLLHFIQLLFFNSEFYNLHTLLFNFRSGHLCNAIMLIKLSAVVGLQVSSIRRAFSPDFSATQYGWLPFCTTFT